MTDETLIVLTPAEWPAFWADNADALADEVGDETECRALAGAGALTIGGGAAERFRISIAAE